ncbi:nuclear transport factor 2 family protein [Embleya sp. NPDC050493]|uniref:nuclear transport factor 2 family protein n=1 Tax=Embleya sp. NPDC050493 TaxID=3363989 RepID=UPI0037ADAC11
MHETIAVHELLHRWWFAYDEGEFDAWEEMFTEDVWFTSRTDTGDHPFEEFIASDSRGRADVLDWQRRHRLACPYPLRHNGTNIHVTGHTDTEVSLSSYIHVTSVENRVPSPVASGIVRATARREGGVYRLAEVHVVLDTMKAVPFGER